MSLLGQHPAPCSSCLLPTGSAPQQLLQVSVPAPSNIPWVVSTPGSGHYPSSKSSYMEVSSPVPPGPSWTLTPRYLCKLMQDENGPSPATPRNPSAPALRHLASGTHSDPAPQTQSPWAYSVVSLPCPWSMPHATSWPKCHHCSPGPAPRWSPASTPAPSRLLSTQWPG